MNMNCGLIIELPLTEGQKERLSELQKLFSDGCNAIAPIVREARCWNRVALHHMVYRQLRSNFPTLGSQMACNVIYSVCRAARAIYQGEGSPWSINSGAVGALPLIRFSETAPVYFDRHTLSLRDGLLSLFTLDGRMRVSVDLDPEFVERFQAGDLREISLLRSFAGFQLSFSFLDKCVEGGHPPIPGHLIIEDPAVVMIAEHRSEDVFPVQKNLIAF